MRDRWQGFCHFPFGCGDLPSEPLTTYSLVSATITQMGKQTNAFQRLCAYLQEQFYPTGTVQESAFVPDKLTGENREIDVLVTVPVDGHEITIGFECRDRKAVDDVTFIELTYAKHSATGINLSVLYSSSGFTEPAQTKAQIFGMRLVKAEEGVAEDWPKWVRDLSTAYLGTISLSPSNVTIQTTDGNAGTPPPETLLLDEAGNPLGEGVDLKLVVFSFLQQKNDLLQTLAPGTKGNGSFKISLPSPIRLADADRRIHEVITISGDLAWDAPLRIPIGLKHKSVEGVPVVFGEGREGDRKAEFHWMNGPNGEKAIVTLQIGKEKPLRADVQPPNTSDNVP